MAITLNGTAGITFPDATLQSSAAFDGANINAVGSSAITLGPTSAQYQVCQITSYTNSYITLPDATQVGLGSNPFVIENRSPVGANLEVRDYAGTTVGYISITQIATVQLKSNSTSAGSWAVELTNQQAFYKYDGNSITTVTNTPSPGIFYGNNYGVVGLTSSLFVRYWGYYNTANGQILMYTQAAVISGSTISFGSIQNTLLYTGGISATSYAAIQTTRLSNTAYAVLFRGYTSAPIPCCSNVAFSAAGRIAVHSVSGTTVTFGTVSAAGMPSFSAGSPTGNQAFGIYLNGIICRISDTSFGLFYNDTMSATYAGPYGNSGSLSAQIVSVSGVTLTIGTKVTLSTSTYTQAVSAVALSSTSVFLSYAQATAAGGSTGRSKMVVISVSGTVPTFNTPVTIESSDVICFGVPTFDGAVAPSATQVVFNIGYGVAEATVSGTVPTWDSTPYGSAQLYPMYLCTSSKAWVAGGGNGGSGGGYINIATGGYVLQTTVTSVLQTNLTVTSASPCAPLGAQPTTSFVAYKLSTWPSYNVATSVMLLGTTT